MRRQQLCSAPAANFGSGGAFVPAIRQGWALSASAEYDQIALCCVTCSEKIGITSRNRGGINGNQFHVSGSYRARGTRRVAPANVGPGWCGAWRRRDERRRRRTGLGADTSGAFRERAAEHPRMGEGPRRSHGQPALWHAVAVREERCQEHLEEPAAIYL